MSECGWYWDPKNECMRMTNILQGYGVIGFHAIMTGQRSCMGKTEGCYFSKDKNNKPKEE